jgi:HEAT repeat protein
MKQYAKRNANTLLLLWLSLTLAAPWKHVSAQEVLHAPPEYQSLAQRLEWAKSTVKKSPLPNGYWIGYSIERYMYEDSHIGWRGRGERDLPTLHELLLGKGRTGPDVARERDILAAVQRTLQPDSADKTQNQKVLKEVAILFRYPVPDANITDFEKVHMSTLDCSVDLEALPLVWLGTVKDTESIPFLDELYKSSQREQCKRALMAAVALHETKNRVIPCLQKYVTQETNTDLRCQATFWLAQQDHRDAFDILKHVAQDDASSKVRKKAVFWIGQKARTDDLIQCLETVAQKDPAREVQKQAVFALSQAPDGRGVEALKRIAGTAKDATTRKEAVFWLGNKTPSDDVVQFLETVVQKDSAPEVRERALHALAQAPQNLGVPALINVAKSHPDKTIRKKAVFWVGHKATSEQSIGCLETVAQKDSAREVRKHAVFALSQAPDGRGVEALARIAKAGGDLTIRKEAIFWLGQKASKKTASSLKNIVFDAEHTELQKQAVFAISRWPKDQSVPPLAEIAKTHPNPEVRKSAIFWLGKTGDPRAADALAEIVRSLRNP